MLKKIYCLLTVLWCLLISTAWAGSIVISVHEQAEVKGPMLILGEIADFSGEDTSRIKNFQSLRLGGAPQPGDSNVLTRELIGMRLSAAGADFSDVIWQIPERVRISVPAQVVTGQELFDCAAEAVKKQLANDSKDNELTVEAVSQPMDMKVTIGELKLKAELPRTIRYNGPTVVKVYASVDGQQVATEAVRLSVKLYKNVIVASKTIMRQETITAESLKSERQDISRLPHSYVTDMSKAIGLTARRDIPLGTPIAGSMLEKPVIVKRGDKVSIVARVNGTEITAPGQAMQDGTENQIIKVQNLNSQKVISAKIIDASSVLVMTNNGK